jgi:cytochrome c oxidase subunit 2
MVGAPKVAENIMTDWLGLPVLASAHGGQIDGLIGWTHVFMLVLFVGWGAFFAYCLVRFRRSRQPVANYTGVKSKSSKYSEIGVAVVEAILLFGFSIPIWAARVDRIPSESEALVVQVTGEQFAWNVHYMGPDGKFGRTDIKLLDLQSNPLGLDRSDPAAKDDVTTLNQLYLPVNKPIIVRLRS